MVCGTYRINRCTQDVAGAQLQVASFEERSKTAGAIKS